MVGEKVRCLYRKWPRRNFCRNVGKNVMSFVNKTADYDCQLKGKSHLSEKGGTDNNRPLLVTASKGRFYK